MRSRRQGLTKRKCKTKAIQADLGMHIHAYCGIFRQVKAHSGIFRYIQDQRHIQNPVKYLKWSVFRK